MKKFNVGLQLYTLRNEMEQDFEGTLKAVKEMGYDYVEFAGFNGKSADEVKEIVDRVGLNAISVHQGTQLFEETGEKAIEYLAEVGVKYCAIPWFNLENFTDNWEKSMESFKNYSKALKEKGIQLLYHNHDFEFNKVDGEYIIDRLYTELSADEICPEFDTCWVHYAGEDPCEYLEKYAGRVDVLHLKDYICTNKGGGSVYALIDKDGKEEKKASKEENGFQFRPLGMGVQNFEAILKSAEKAGTEYVIVEQDESPDMSPLEAVKISREYLRKLGC